MTRTEMIQELTGLAFNVPDEQLRRALKVINQENTKRDLITTKQTAGVLEVHPETVKRYAKQGLLHPIRFSKRRMRFDRAEVLQFLNNGLEEG